MISNNTRLKFKATLLCATLASTALLPAFDVSPACAQGEAKQAQAADAFLEAYTAARDKLIAHDYVGARPLWEKARELAREPQYAKTPQNLAWATYGYGSSLLGLGNIALREKRYDEAKALGEEVVALKEAKSRVLAGRAHSLLAAVYRERGDMVGLMRESKLGMPNIPGLENFGKGGKVADADLNQLFFYGLIGDTRGKTPEQIRDALKALAQDTAAPRQKRQAASLGMGTISMQLKQFAQAREEFNKTLAEFPGGMWIQAEVAHKIGDSYAAEGNWALAVESYDLALENTPKREPRDLAGMADAALLRKRDDAARRAG